MFRDYNATTRQHEGEAERYLYKDALSALVRNSAQCIFIGLALQRWFRQNVRYTLLASMDINGFIPSTLEINETSEEEAAGTIDSEHFEKWVERYLCPVLGNYENSEAHSIVIMDNASTHLNRQLEDLIEAKGAYLLYIAPYFPDLNPIDLGFNHCYKKIIEKIFRAWN